MRRTTDLLVQLTLTAAIAWASIYAMSASGMFITQVQSYRSIASVK